MSEYDMVKRGKLILNTDKKAKKRKHKKHSKEKRESSSSHSEDADIARHGGWRRVKLVSEITGSVAIQFGERTYVTALDNGLFTLGAPHNEGDGPSPEEILTAIPVGENNKFALKSGYGKYLGITKDGIVTGRADAVGALEQWEAVFEEEKMAILSALGNFMSVTKDDDSLVALSKIAAVEEFCTIRSQSSAEVDLSSQVPKEEKGNLEEVEINYVKQFQKFQDKKMKINQGDRSELKKAKVEGNLHETLLDRRSKMKADRYCK